MRLALALSLIIIGGFLIYEVLIGNSTEIINSLRGQQQSSSDFGT